MFPTSQPLLGPRGPSFHGKGRLSSLKAQSALESGAYGHLEEAECNRRIREEKQKNSEANEPESESRHLPPKCRCKGTCSCGISDVKILSTPSQDPERRTSAQGTWNHPRDRLTPPRPGVHPSSQTWSSRNTNHPDDCQTLLFTVCGWMTRMTSIAWRTSLLTSGWVSLPSTYDASSGCRWPGAEIVCGRTSTSQPRSTHIERHDPIAVTSSIETRRGAERLWRWRNKESREADSAQELSQCLVQTTPMARLGCHGASQEP